MKLRWMTRFNKKKGKEEKFLQQEVFNNRMRVWVWENIPEVYGEDV